MAELTNATRARVIYALGVLAISLFLQIAAGTDVNQTQASCNMADGKKVPIGCLSPDTEPNWYIVGGGSAGRPMVARSFGI
jgi:hypothetical protein